MADLNLKDEQLIRTKALPASASASITTDAIQLIGGADSQGGFYSECELLIEVPALSATILPAAVVSPAAAAGKLTVSVEESDTDSADAWNSAATIYSFDIEGGESGGSAAVEKRFRLPIGVKKYIRVKATTNATATDASAVTLTASLVF